MDLSPKKRDRIRGFQRLGFQLGTPVIAFVFACASLLVSLSESERIMIAGISLRQIAFLCAFASAAFQLYCSIRKCITKRDYAAAQRTAGISLDTELYGMQRDCAEGSLLQQLDALHYGPPAETSPKVSSLGRCDSRCAYSSGFP